MARSQSWAFLSRALVAAGLSSRNANGMISENSMRTKMMTAMTWVAVEDFPVTWLCSAVR